MTSGMEEVQQELATIRQCDPWVRNVSNEALSGRCRAPDDVHTSSSIE